MNLISVIVPIYNVEKYLDRCINSIVIQTYKNIEIILVDDGSPDRCPEICDSWEKRDDRIVVIHKENGGLSDARNVGLKRATGKYILYVDSDDYIVEDACERFMNVVEDEDIIIGEATIIESDNIIHRVHTNLSENKVYTGGEYSKLAIRKGEWFAAACYNMYRREYLLENNLFFVKGILHEDNEFLPRLFLPAKKVKYLNYEFYKYIIREDSICSKKSDKNLKDLFYAYEKWYLLNEGIESKTLKKSYAGALCKYFMATCREYKITDSIFPEGITKKYLLLNALNAKEFLKVVLFIFSRKLYMKIASRIE